MGDGENDHLHIRQRRVKALGRADINAAGDQTGHGDIPRALGQTYKILQKDRHADGRNQRYQPVAAPQRTVGHPFDTVTIGAGYQHTDDKSTKNHQRQKLYAHQRQCRQHHKGNVTADHVHLAMGEVDHADDAVDHGVTDGDQRIGTADCQSVEQLLN